MLRSSSAWAIALVATLLFSYTAPLCAQSEVRIPADALADPLSELIQEAQGLESESRWGEAISLYEDALRDYPNNRALEERHDFAKLQYDLGRRYEDVSFRNSLRAITAQQALDLYSEVMLKINAHYVSAPDWKRMISRGTTSLDLALSNDDFVRTNLARIDRAQVTTFRREMYQIVGAATLRTRHDARELVRRVGRLAEHRLGLSTVAVAMEYTAAAMGGLDAYSAFLTGDQLRDIYSQIEGNFVGLGVELKADEGSLLIVHVIPGSPAEQAGIRSGDRIVAVDGKTTVELTTSQAAAQLAGEEGTIVEVSVVSPGQSARSVRVRRAHVEVPSIENARVVDADYGIAYMRLASFQKTTLRDVDRALWDLHRKGMRSLVIDLRGNPGGLLTAAVEVADKFVQNGTIVSTKGRSPQEDYNYVAHQTGTWRVPLVVLVDGDSASASEIFAGAIRDHRRGAIVGDRTYGKGSVQGIFPLAIGGAGVRITTAKFYSPSGRAISKVGVQPDIVVRQAAKTAGETLAANEDEDPVLDAGVQYARRQMASR